uniref:rhodanese-like domain-containing protein n=2 Tax=Gammaproteobacteria TaxID=1236 RepID=UPI00321C291E
FVDANYVLSKIDDDSSLTVDARSKARFLAQVAEPRPGIRSGHIPGACCLPFAELMNGHQMKSPTELQLILQQALIRPADEYL